MSYAVRHRYIDYNPVRDAERPKATGKIEIKADMQVLPPEQIKTLLEAEPDQKYKTLFLMAVMTGMRQGELLGLKWSDIDFEKKQTHVQRTFNHGRFFTPKTKGSIRKIDLSPVVILELMKWRLASGRNELDIVFPNKVGKPMECQKMMIRHFIPALTAAKLPRVRFHDLRHTYASLLIEQGENIKYIQNQLGHSSPMVTLNVYAHLMKDSNQEAVCKLENSIFKTTGHNMVTEKEKGVSLNS
jgi:integrase